MTNFQSIISLQSLATSGHAHTTSARYIASALNILVRLDSKNPLTAHQLSEMTGEYGPCIGQRCRALRQMGLVKMVRVNVTPFDVFDPYTGQKLTTIDHVNGYVLA